MAPLLLPPEALANIETLAGELELSNFDLLLVGDGSGTIYQQPGGWACTAYDRRSRRAWLHTGAVSGATNNFAELLPYVHALWYAHQELLPVGPGPIQVQIVSDSELTVRCGNGCYQRRANACLWAAITWFEQNGYRLRWRHVPRNTNPWNRLADRVAGQVRKALVQTLKEVSMPTANRASTRS